MSDTTTFLTKYIRELRRQMYDDFLEDAAPELEKGAQTHIFTQLYETLADFSFYMNPIRLTILAFLYRHWRIESAELRSILRINWGNFNANVKALEKQGLIDYVTELTDGSLKKVIYLTEHGYSEYMVFTQFMTLVFNVEY